MTPALRRACEREKAASAQPEHIRPIVRRTVADLEDRRAARFILDYLDDPAIRSLWGDPVEP